MEENFKVSEGARMLKINISTAKFIVRSYKKKGKVMKKKSDQVREMIEEEKQKLQSEL